MKFWEVMGKVVASIWRLIAFNARIVLISIVALIILTILMPENAIKAIEIVKGLFP